LRKDGIVVGWGGHIGYGQSSPPFGLNSVTAISAGGLHSLALRSDGTVVGWGDNQYGQVTPPHDLADAVAICAGSQHSLALRSDGTVVGWGDNQYGQATVPTGLKHVAAIAAGTYASYALHNDGTLSTWGDNSSTQISVPSGLSNAVLIAAGESHAVILLRSKITDRSPPWIQPLGNSKFNLRFQGMVGRTYTIQTTRHLADNLAWSTAWSGVLSARMFSLPWNGTEDPCRFFRIIPEPNGPLGLTITPVSSNALNLVLTGTAGGNYTIQATTALPEASDWTTVWTGVPGNSSVLVNWTNVDGQARQFRVTRP
ncbi:MAG TPA: hypothetical protein VEC99_01130, partial [Clostridia bacterium]|nr:hypothetical protein [Clostridia bacterium]